MVVSLTYRAAGSNGSCLQQNLDYSSPNGGGVLAVCVQVAEELLDYQVRVLRLKQKMSQISESEKK